MLFLDWCAADFLHRRSPREYHPRPPALMGHPSGSHAGSRWCSGKAVLLEWFEDKDMLEKLSHCKEMGAAFLADAAMAVVVMADPLASDVWIEDAAIASIMIQLQAEDLGLGSCWIQVRERFTATGMPSGEYVHTLLDIPLQLQVVSIIAVGHKGMERKPFNEDHLQWEKIHINKFGGK